MAVNNGTTALWIAYRALGISDGKQVLTSPNTFVATTNTALLQGAEPVFVDIDPRSYNLSPDKVESYLQNHDTRRLAGLVPVHFAGYPVDMQRIRQIADKNNLFVLEDACHAPGARRTDRSGKMYPIGSCNFSDAAVMSFHPVKHITTGEGGVLLTNREDIVQEARRLRSHGITRHCNEFDNGNSLDWYYEMKDLGINGRITDFQCALGISQLRRLDSFLSRRRKHAERYDRAFRDLDHVEVPACASDIEHAYHLYVVKVPNRDLLYRYLRDRGIGSQVHYIPVYKHPYYRDSFEIDESRFPEVERYYREALSLPLFPGLEKSDQQRVIDAIRDFFREKGAEGSTVASS